jgi:integrase/recombinase XerD
MPQTLPETGAKASELVRLRIEDVSLIERVVDIRQGKSSKRRVAPRRSSTNPMAILTVSRGRDGIGDPWA